MSRDRCCVPGCIEGGKSHSVLHGFPDPEKKPAQFNSWIYAVGGDILGLDNQYIYKLRRVCHAHFEQKYCCRFNRISKIAVPTVSLPGSLAMPQFSVVERRPLRTKQNLMNDATPSTSKGVNIPLHLFPHPDKLEEQFKTWVWSIGSDILGLTSNDIYRRCRVCSKHFEEKFKCRSKRLSKIAVPTLHIPGPLSFSKLDFAERLAVARPSKFNKEQSSNNVGDDTHCIFEDHKLSTAKGPAPDVDEAVAEPSTVSELFGIPLHHFPDPDVNIEKYYAWISNIGGDITAMDHSEVYSKRRVCHKHFDEIYKYPRNRLSKIAIPSLYLSGPLHHFPLPSPDKERFYAWKKVLDYDVQVKGNAYIYHQLCFCNKHFESFYVSPSNRLTRNAVPTLYISKVMHRFPNPEKFPLQFKAWVEICGGMLEKPEDCVQYFMKRVCSIHFTQRDRNRNNRLNALAVPSLYLPDMHPALHCFPNPLSAKERFNTWLYAVSGDIIALKNDIIFKYRRVCHRHFEKKFYCRNNRLSNIAVPTLHMTANWKPSSNKTAQSEEPVDPPSISQVTVVRGGMLHCFPNPAKDSERFRIWMMNIGGEIIGLQDEFIYKSRRVCHKHFSEKYLYRSNRISKTAVPQIEVTGSFGLFDMELGSEEETIQESVQITCVNNGNTGADNAILHSFPNPNKDKARYYRWVEAIGISISAKDPQYVFKTHRVCHIHFETHYLTWSKRLCFGAVPTLYLTGLDVSNEHNYTKKAEDEVKDPVPVQDTADVDGDAADAGSDNAVITKTATEERVKGPTQIPSIDLTEVFNKKDVNYELRTCYESQDDILIEIIDQAESEMDYDTRTVEECISPVRMEVKPELKDLCRCCGDRTQYRSIDNQYEWCGEKEMYADIIQTCFGLKLSKEGGRERLICESCVERLRNADAFRRRVLRTENNFLELLYSEDRENAEKDRIKKKKKKKVKKLPLRDEEQMNVIEEEIIDREDMDYEIKEEVKEEKKEDNESDDCVSTIADDNGAKENEIKHRMMMEKQESAMNTLAIIHYSYAIPFENAYNEYLCMYCRQKHQTYTEMRDHTLQHDVLEVEQAIRKYKRLYTKKRYINLDISRIDCRLCDEKINDIDTFKTHIALHGVEMYDAREDYIKFKLENGFDCLECGRTFLYYRALKQHMAEHVESYMCEICGVHYFDETVLIRHLKMKHKYEPELYPCECGRHFPTEVGRKLHRKFHGVHKPPKLLCEKCNEPFCSVKLFKRHMYRVHGITQKYMCEKCGKSYRKLWQHYKISHEKSFRHKCNVCDASFFLPSTLKNHIMVKHTGELQFVCDICDELYATKKTLTKHMKKKHLQP